MNDDEAQQFESNPHYESCVKVRRYNDLGKVPDMPTADLESYRPLLKSIFFNSKRPWR